MGDLISDKAGAIVFFSVSAATHSPKLLAAHSIGSDVLILSPPGMETMQQEFWANAHFLRADLPQRGRHAE